ncbi:MAG: hypothetical protein H0V70_26015 [Ktedonobacteraceae bacterium]|nr:hypothetical protein [Ktedonobacteraceae bacterium]
MNITPEEAQAALNDIQHATRTAQNAFNIWAYHMLIWGSVWVICFLISQFQPQWIPVTWTVMVLCGIVGSAVVGMVQGRRTRTAPGSRAAFIGSRLGIFYGVLYCFIILWLIIFPLTPPQVALLWITVVMFGYINAGLWLQQPTAIVLGVAVTCMSVIGYYLLPNYFWLWSAVFAGLPLVCLGTYLLRRK